MVNYISPHLDSVFLALSDPTRRGMIHSLTGGRRTARELAAPFTISLPAVSKHLKILERARLIQRKIIGRTHIFSLDAKSLNHAAAWLAGHQRFWEQNLHKLDRYLKEEKRRNRA